MFFHFVMLDLCHTVIINKLNTNEGAGIFRYVLSVTCAEFVFMSLIDSVHNNL